MFFDPWFSTSAWVLARNNGDVEVGSDEWVEWFKAVLKVFATVEAEVPRMFAAVLAMLAARRRPFRDRFAHQLRLAVEPNCEVPART